MCAAVISNLNGSNEGRASLDGQAVHVRRATERALMKKPALICRSWSLIINQPPTTLVNVRRRQEGRVKKDCRELNWGDNRPRVRSIRDTQPDEDVGRNFEEQTGRAQKQLDLLLKRGMHMHGRGHPISLVFCLFSSSRCLFIVLAHKQDRRPVAKINRVKCGGN